MIAIIRIIIYLLYYNHKMIDWLDCSIYYQIHTFDNNLCNFLYIFLNFWKLKYVLFALIFVLSFSGETAPSIGLVGYFMISAETRFCTGRYRSSSAVYIQTLYYGKFNRSLTRSIILLGVLYQFIGQCLHSFTYIC